MAGEGRAWVSACLPTWLARLLGLGDEAAVRPQTHCAAGSGRPQGCPAAGTTFQSRSSPLQRVRLSPRALPSRFKVFCASEDQVQCKANEQDGQQTFESARQGARGLHSPALPLPSGVASPGQGAHEMRAHQRQHQAAGAGVWAPAPPLDNGGDDCSEARRRELRDFIALRRAALGKGPPPAAVQQPPLQQHPQQRRHKRQQAAPPAAMPLPTSWQAIKQQAHQGFEQLLRQAGLPVNAGLSRPASFTAAGLQWQQQAQQHHLQQQQQQQQQQPCYLPAGAAGGWQPQAQPAWQAAYGEGTPWQPQVAWPEPAMHPASRNSHAHHPAWHAGWPACQLDAASPFAAMPAYCPQPHWGQPLQQQQQQAGHCQPAADGPGQAAGSLHQSQLPRPASIGGAADARAPCSQVGSSRRSSAAGSFAHAGSEAGDCCFENHAGAAADATAAGTAADISGSPGSSLVGCNMRPDGAGAGSARSSVCLSSLDALAAAAEEEDITQLGSEAWEQAAAVEDALLGQPEQLEAAGQTDRTHGHAELALAPELPGAALQQHSGLQQQAGVPTSQSPVQAAFKPPAGMAGMSVPVPGQQQQQQQQPEGDSVSATAAAALARFEQLQQQLRQLQAGLLPTAGAASPALVGDPGYSGGQLARASSTAFPHMQSEADRAAATGGSTAENSSVQQVMQQAESFLEQAQALLQRLQAAAASPPQLDSQLPRPELQQQEQQPDAAVAHFASAQLPAAVQPDWQPQWQEQQRLAAPVPAPAAAWDDEHAGQQVQQGAFEQQLAWSPPGWTTAAGWTTASMLPRQSLGRPGTGRPGSGASCAAPLQWEQAEQGSALPAELVQHQHWLEQQAQQPHHRQQWQRESMLWTAASEASLAVSPRAGQPLAWGRQHARRQRAAKLRPLSYAQQLRGVAAASAPLQASAAKQESGSYVQAAQLAKERAAREAAERERLRQENEAARQAAKQRALLDKQRQQEQEAAVEQRARQVLRRPSSGTARGGSAYLQRLQGRQAQQGQVPGVPGWARPARLLPLLLLPGSKSSSPAQQQAEHSPRPGSVGQVASRAADAADESASHRHSADVGAAGVQPLGPPPAEEQSEEQAVPHRSAKGQPAPTQGVQLVLPPLQLSGSERELQQLQAELAELDSRMARQGGAAAAQASVELCSRANSQLQRRLQASLDRLDAAALPGACL
ncbi:hypothetical protein ABPG75_008663 [Micractinium tetrahymenae]